MSSVNAYSFSPHAVQRWTDAQQAMRTSFNRSVLAREDAAAAEHSGLSANFSAASRRLARELHASRDAAAEQRNAVFAQARQILTRMAELKEVSIDTDETSRSAYDDEFTQLQSDLLSLGEQLGEGNPLLHGAEGAPEAGETAAADTDAQGGPVAQHAFTDDFSTADNWESSDGELSVSDGTFYPNAAGGFGAVQGKQSFSGAMEVKFDLFLPGANDSLDLTIGGTTISNLTDSLNTNKWQQHSVRIVYDGVDSAATYVDGADTPADVRSGLGSLSGVLGFANFGEGSARLRDFSLRTIDSEEAAAATAAAAATNAAAIAIDEQQDEFEQSGAGLVVEAGSLDEVQVEDFTAAMEELDAYREDNSSTPVEADPEATEQIDDPDAHLAELAQVEEANELLRQEILIDSASAFLAQANVDGETAFRLLG